MRLLLVFALFVTAESKHEVYGICVEECSMTNTGRHLMSFGVGGCPDGFVCQSNGCGHVCQPDTVAWTKRASPDKRQLVGICVEECSLTKPDSHIMSALGIGGCPDGQVCRSNGCGHTCQPGGSMTTVAWTKPPARSTCSNVFCFMFCANGFQDGPDGCPICKCA